MKDRSKCSSRHRKAATWKRRISVDGHRYLVKFMICPDCKAIASADDFYGSGRREWRSPLGADEVNS